MNHANLSTSDGIRILDARGCLTAEAMCFGEELGPDQRAVVDRHVRACAVCSQQQAGLSHAAQRVRHGRPRVTVPADARIAARQAILRSLMLHRNKLRVASQQAAAAAAATEDQRRVNRRGWLWVVLTFGALAAFGASIVALLLR